MRNRGKAPSTDAQPDQLIGATAPMVRLYAPSDLDLDGLAEALRVLLAPDPAPQIQPSDSSDSDLLSPADRAIHVEASEAE